MLQGQHWHLLGTSRWKCSRSAACYGRVEHKRESEATSGLNPNSRFCQPPASHTHTHTHACARVCRCLYLSPSRARALSSALATMKKFSTLPHIEATRTIAVFDFDDTIAAINVEDSMCASPSDLVFGGKARLASLASVNRTQPLVHRLSDEIKRCALRILSVLGALLLCVSADVQSADGGIPFEGRVVR